MSAKILEEALYGSLQSAGLVQGYEQSSGLAVVTNPNSADIADCLRQTVYTYLRRPENLKAIRQTCRYLIRYKGSSLLESNQLVGEGCVIQVIIKHVQDRSNLPNILIGETTGGVVLYINFRHSLSIDINAIATQVATLLSPQNIGALLL